MHHEETVRIDAPLEEVFAYLTDPANLPEWDSDIRMGRYRTGGPPSVGTEIEIERTVPPSRTFATFRGRITEYTPATSLGVSVDEGPLPFDLRYTFTERSASTDLSVEIRSRPKGLRRVLEPLASRAIRRQVSGHYARLKQILERRRAERQVPDPAAED